MQSANPPPYSEIIETFGIKVPFAEGVITPKIERALRRGNYESGECKTLQSLLSDEDRVLDIGAGLGLVSALAARIVGGSNVVAVEANPALLPVIRETYRVNEIEHVDLRHGMVSPTGDDSGTFYLRRDFWASSMEPDSRPYVETVEVPGLRLGDLISEFKPSIVSCDIEGAELGLFDDADLSGVRHLIVELHPKVYGTTGVRRIVEALARHGFCRSPLCNGRSTVWIFDALNIARRAPGSLMPPRAYRPWPITKPRILLPTCMKDEGPFILEWIAWHRAVGITDFVIFTNDCTDGTDALLDRLAEMGVVRHLPNPALATESPRLQPAALRYQHYLPEMRDADFCISMDVDEFINVRIGDGTLQSLFARTGDFDVVSISEVNHGNNGVEGFATGWITEQFPGHQTLSPPPRQARRGVKSIVRLSPRVGRIKNHRPEMLPFAGHVDWIDGSGRPTAHFRDESQNGHDVRGTYDLVALDHYPLRSLDSYLVKMFRGDVVVKDKQVSARYWSNRNHHEETHEPFRILSAAKAEYDALLEDPLLATLHKGACAAHSRRIEELRDKPEFAERREQVLQETPDPVPVDNT